MSGTRVQGSNASEEAQYASEGGWQAVGGEEEGEWSKWLKGKRERREEEEKEEGVGWFLPQ